MSKKIALGQGVEKTYVGTVSTEDPGPIEERLNLIEARMDTIANWIGSLEGHSAAIVPTPAPVDNPNKDGLPIGLALVGTTKGVQHVLVTGQDTYTVVPLFDGPTHSYPSLSAAAEAVSGVRRSGWTFWKVEDGRSIKEAFRK